MDSTLIIVEQIGKQLNLIIGLIVAIVGAAAALWHQINKLKHEVRSYEKSTKTEI